MCESNGLIALALGTNGVGIVNSFDQLETALQAFLPAQGSSVFAVGCATGRIVAIGLQTLFVYDGPRFDARATVPVRTLVFSEIFNQLVNDDWNFGSTVATAVAMADSGNYAFVGTSRGKVYVVNLDSSFEVLQVVQAFYMTALAVESPIHEMEFAQGHLFIAAADNLVILPFRGNRLIAGERQPVTAPACGTQVASSVCLQAFAVLGFANSVGCLSFLGELIVTTVDKFAELQATLEPSILGLVIANSGITDSDEQMIEARIESYYTAMTVTLSEIYATNPDPAVTLALRVNVSNILRAYICVEVNEGICQDPRLEQGSIFEAAVTPILSMMGVINDPDDGISGCSYLPLPYAVYDDWGCSQRYCQAALDACVADSTCNTLAVSLRDTVFADISVPAFFMPTVTALGATSQGLQWMACHACRCPDFLFSQSTTGGATTIAEDVIATLIPGETCETHDFTTFPTTSPTVPTANNNGTNSAAPTLSPTTSGGTSVCGTVVASAVCAQAFGALGFSDAAACLAALGDSVAQIVEDFAAAQIALEPSILDAFRSAGGGLSNETLEVEARIESYFQTIISTIETAASTDPNPAVTLASRTFISNVIRAWVCTDAGGSCPVPRLDGSSIYAASIGAILDYMGVINVPDDGFLGCTQLPLLYPIYPDYACTERRCFPWREGCSNDGVCSPTATTLITNIFGDVSDPAVFSPLVTTLGGTIHGLQWMTCHACRCPGFLFSQSTTGGATTIAEDVIAAFIPGDTCETYQLTFYPTPAPTFVRRVLQGSNSTETPTAIPTEIPTSQPTVSTGGSVAMSLTPSQNSRIRFGIGKDVLYLSLGSSGRMLTYDISDLQAPALLGSSSFPNGFRHVFPRADDQDLNAEVVAITRLNVAIYSAINPNDVENNLVVEHALSTLEPMETTLGILMNGRVFIAGRSLANFRSVLLTANVYQLDALQVPPIVSGLTIEDISSGAIIDSDGSGSVEENWQLRVTAIVSDDIAMRNVIFFINGIREKVDSTYVFSHAIQVPSLSQLPVPVMDIRVVAVDIGGNNANFTTTISVIEA